MRSDDDRGSRGVYWGDLRFHPQPGDVRSFEPEENRRRVGFAAAAQEHVMELEMGPLQLIAVGFEHTTLDGAVLAELERLSDLESVRMVDLIAVTKQDDGEIVAVEHTELSLDEQLTYAAWVGGLIGFAVDGPEGIEAGAYESMLLADQEYEYGLDEDAIQTLAADIPGGGAALVAVLEHRWAIPLRNAIRAHGGIAIAQDFLNPETLLDLGVVAGAELSR